MNTGRMIFSQLMDFLPLHEFRKCVARYNGDSRLRSFSCLDQFYCMAFAQLACLESLRHIETCVLLAIAKKRLGLAQDLAHILQVICVTILEKSPFFEVFSHSPVTYCKADTCNQLTLFDF